MKMLNGMLILDGESFPYAAKQPKHSWVDFTDPTNSITGNTFVLTIGFKSSEIPEEKVILWTTKQYKMLSTMAGEYATVKNMDFYQALQKVTWRTLFNQPRVLVIYAKYRTDFVKGVMNFALMHGTTVVYSDFTAGIDRMVIPPVTNLYQHPLFKLFKVEEFDLSTVSRAERLKIRLKLMKLNDHRAAWTNKLVWPKVNKALKVINDFYYEHQNMQRWEYAEQVNHDELVDVATALGYQVPEDAAIDEMANVVNIWGRAFGIQNRYMRHEQSIDEFRDAKQYKHQPGWVYNRSVEVSWAAKNRIKYFAFDKAQLLRDYEQIIWFLSQKYAGDFMDDGWMFCEFCDEHPVHESHEHCDRCGHENYMFTGVPSSYDDNK